MITAITAAAARLDAATALPGALAASFDAFETIRLAARACEDRTPDLLATFMTAAGTAAEGRDTVLAAPSFPATGHPAATPRPAAGGEDAEKIADALAALATQLAASLVHSAAGGTGPGDRAACADAARAASEIRDLLERAGDDTDVR